MIEYYDLFSQYLNILGVIWGAIKFGLLSFIIALIILIFLRKIVLVQRRYCILKYIARSYYFFIPIICLFFGSYYGFITTAREQVMGKLPFYQTTAQSFIAQNFNIDININVKTIRYADKNLDNIIHDTLSNINQVILEKSNLAPQAQGPQKIQQLMLIALESPVGINYIKAKLKERVSTISGIKQQLVNRVFEVKLSRLLTGEMLIEIISFYITLGVNSLLLPIIIIWAALLLIPLVEIMFAYFYNKRYQVLI